MPSFLLVVVVVVVVFFLNDDAVVVATILDYLFSTIKVDTLAQHRIVVSVENQRNNHHPIMTATTTRRHSFSFLCFLIVILGCTIPQSSSALNLQPPSPPKTSNRRTMLQDLIAVTAPSSAAAILLSGGLMVQPGITHAADSKGSYSEMLPLVMQARQQLTPVPKLIENEKWDSVRAILIEPPLSDCWARTGRPLLTKFAEALGDQGGDELAALEAREEIVSHLRYLDMAVYNNNFNPIKTEGETGASASLIRSYYEDPKNEFKSTVTAFEELLSLTSGL